MHYMTLKRVTFKHMLTPGANYKGAIYLRCFLDFLEEAKVSTEKKQCMQTCNLHEDRHCNIAVLQQRQTLENIFN